MDKDTFASFIEIESLRGRIADLQRRVAHLENKLGQTSSSSHPEAGGHVLE
jgi:hypothetical protein